ncbi:DNRLRE domain-containing protein [Streptomyces sp. NPDC014889]|uniref:DNRLRE domain-containing protein n=1 Tax=Streptomyces sp. NPDC014889 TaxID=3364928 RepID=UPI0036F82CB3
MLTPDPAFFEQDLTYPVTVDPTSTLAVTTDTWVQKPDYPDSQQGSQELKSGSYDGGTHVAHSYLKFDVSKFKGTHILKATMSLYSYYSSSCDTTKAPTVAKRITSSWDSAKITWATQPTTSDTNSSSNTGRWGYDSTCPPNWSNWGMTKLVQDWADGQPNYGLQISSADDKDVTAWRRFRSANYTTVGYAPKLVVDYNTKPGTPTLVAPATGAVTTNGKPTLQAKATDADGDTVQLTFEVWKSDGTAALQTGKSASVASGTTASWTPATVLAGGAYKWRVQAYDGTDTSAAWSGWNTLTVDSSAPASPTLTSTSHPSILQHLVCGQGLHGYARGHRDQRHLRLCGEARPVVLHRTRHHGHADRNRPQLDRPHRRHVVGAHRCQEQRRPVVPSQALQVQRRHHCARNSHRPQVPHSSAQYQRLQLAQRLLQLGGAGGPLRYRGIRGEGGQNRDDFAGHHRRLPVRNLLHHHRHR